jgi:hypothetical protein
MVRTRAEDKMSTIRSEVTGRRVGSRPAPAATGHNQGPPLDLASWIELQRIIDLKEASRLSGLSIDTIKRRFKDKIIALSRRRRGLRLGVALMLNEAED